MAEEKLDICIKSRDDADKAVRSAVRTPRENEKKECCEKKNGAPCDGALNGVTSEGVAKRISVVSILVFKRENAEKVNGILSKYGEYVIGRMGIPYKEKAVSVLSVALDAPVEVTNALTGKLGKVDGVFVKALFGKI